jgi:hypothetical protein
MKCHGLLYFQLHSSLSLSLSLSLSHVELLKSTVCKARLNNAGLQKISFAHLSVTWKSPRPCKRQLISFFTAAAGVAQYSAVAFMHAWISQHIFVWKDRHYSWPDFFFEINMARFI